MLAIVAFGSIISTPRTIEVTAVDPTPTPPPTTIVQPPRIEPTDLVTYADKYEIPYDEYYCTLKGESRFYHEDLYGDNGNSYGIAQYNERTFYRFVADAVKQGQFFSQFNYKDREDQLELTAWAFSQGTEYQDDWTCWRSYVQHRNETGSTQCWCNGPVN